jgi:hypothetical protein
MLPINECLLHGIVLGVIFGAAIAALITYFATVHFTESSSVRAFYEGKEAALGELRMERFVDTSEEGIIRKKHYLVIRERLVYKNIPISPFWEHQLLTNEKLDKEALDALTHTLANVADKLLGLADFRKMALEALKSTVGGVLKNGKSGTNK